MNSDMGHVIGMIPKATVERYGEEQKEHFATLIEEGKFFPVKCGQCGAEGYALESTVIRFMEQHSDEAVNYGCPECVNISADTGTSGLIIDKRALDALKDFDSLNVDRESMVHTFASQMINAKLTFLEDVPQDDDFVRDAVAKVIEAMSGAMEMAAERSPVYSPEGAYQITLLINVVRELHDRGQYASAARAICAIRDNLAS